MRRQQQQQLQQILNETFANYQYIDDNISHLIKPQQQLQLKNVQSQQSIHGSSSDNSLHYQNAYHQSFSSHQQNQQKFGQRKKSEQLSQQLPQHNSHIFQQLQTTINKLKQPIQLQKIKQEYPLYLISQPTYTITQNIIQKVLAYDQQKIKDIQVIDIGFCQETKSYKIAIGNDRGEVVIMEQTPNNGNKCVLVLKAFDNTTKIMAIKWSQKLQYLAISNDNQQLKIYMFKQTIQIQNQIILKLIKNPIQFGYINNKNIENSINQIKFVSQNPVNLLIVDEEQQIFFLEFKKHILNIRPYLSLLPFKFLDIHQLQLYQIKLNGDIGYLMAIGSQNFVTLCILQPKFQIILVYDKQKRCGLRHGYSHISFRSNPLSLLIGWQDFIEIIDINITKLEPVQYNMRIFSKCTLTSPSIKIGFLTNTLVYQLTSNQIKVYSTNNFQKDGSIYKYKPIYIKKLDYSTLSNFNKIQNAIQENQITLQILHLLQGITCIANKNLFIITKSTLLSIKIQQFSTYITNMIENINNWKIGLQILKDSYNNIVYQLDGINQDLVLEKLKQYSLRYLSFLESIIKDNQQLWSQEILFLINILIQCNLIKYLMDTLIFQLYLISKKFIKNIIPFILENKITYITMNAYQLLQTQLPRFVLSKLLINLNMQINQSELPHQLNKFLLQNRYYTELVLMNTSFKNYYESFALLIAKYFTLNEDDLQLCLVLGYNSYNVLHKINLSEFNREIQIEQSILDWYLDMLSTQISSILIKSYPELLFQWILPELYSGKCLILLNKYSNHNLSVDVMSDIIQKIPFTLVHQNQCQHLYWIRIIDLYARKIIKHEIWTGIKFLTLQANVSKATIDQLVENCHETLVKQFQSLSYETLNGYFEKIQKTQYISLIQILGIILKQYMPVLHAMLACEQYRNERLYDYLQSIIDKFNEKDLLYLKKVIKQKIQLFTQIDPQRAANIICQYYSQDAQMFINQLNLDKYYPFLQLKLNLLIKFGGQEDVTTALKIYFKILSDNILLPETQFRNMLLDTMKKCLDVCIQTGHYHHQKQWFVIMQELQELKGISSKKLGYNENLKIREIINQHAYPQLIKALVCHISDESIINQLRGYISRFDIEAIRVIIGELMKNYLYKKQVLQVSRQLNVQTQLLLRKTLLKNQMIGFRTSNVCSFCKKSSDNTLIHYKCGHDIHPYCNENVKQCIICSQKIVTQFEKLIDAVDKVKTIIIPANQDQIKIPFSKQLQKQNMFQKLNQFDRNCKLNKLYHNYQYLFRYR